MPTREIKGVGGRDFLGLCHTSYQKHAKQREIKKLTVFPDDNRNVILDVEYDDSRLIQRLTPTAALEVAKGILQNLPYVYIAADDELIHIMKTACADAERDARAACEAITRPLVKMPSRLHEADEPGNRMADEVANLPLELKENDNAEADAGATGQGTDEEAPLVHEQDRGRGTEGGPEGV